VKLQKKILEDIYCSQLNISSVDIGAHMLNDGVCDCCDGSDESVGWCPDKCSIWAAEASAEAEEKMKALALGKSKFNEYLHRGVAMTAEREAAAVRAKAELEHLEAVEKEAEIRKDQLAAKEVIMGFPSYPLHFSCNPLS